jgi:hypothetical protein
MAAIDLFPVKSGDITQCGIGVFPCVKSDTEELEFVTRAIIWKADGTIKFTCLDGSTGELTMTAGYRLDQRIKQIWDTGTDLDNDQIMCIK